MVVLLKNVPTVGSHLGRSPFWVFWRRPEMGALLRSVGSYSGVAPGELPPVLFGGAREGRKWLFCWERACCGQMSLGSHTC